MTRYFADDEEPPLPYLDEVPPGTLDVFRLQYEEGTATAREYVNLLLLACAADGVEVVRSHAHPEVKTDLDDALEQFTPGSLSFSEHRGFARYPEAVRDAITAWQASRGTAGG